MNISVLFLLVTAFLATSCIHENEEVTTPKTIRYKITWLGVLPSSSTFSIAKAINNQTQIVGNSRKSFNEVSFFWEGGVMEILKTKDSTFSSQANDINDNEIIVGSQNNFISKQPVIWKNKKPGTLKVNHEALNNIPLALNDQNKIVGIEGGILCF